MKKKLNCVLLIDDNEDDNFYHELILRETGTVRQIEVAETGHAALNFLQKTLKAPELIFLDINMPRMNGWEFLEQYRKLKTNQKANAIIMLTTSLNPEDKKRANAIQEVNGFETKPLTHQMIEEILNNFFPDI